MSALLVLTLLTALYCASIVVAPTLWLTVPLGLLTLFFSPGYGIVALGAGERKRWPWYFTAPLVVGLSVGFNVGVGVLLLAGHFGLPPLVLGITALLTLFLGAAAHFSRSAPATDSRFGTMVRSELGLRNFDSGQRVAAYALLVGIIVLVAGLIYIASVNPKETADVSLGITGPDGTVASIPARINISTPATVLLTVGNDNTAQGWNVLVSASATLAGNSLANGTVPPPAPSRSVRWSTPLYLANGNFSETSLGVLAPNQVLTFNLTVQFNSTIPATPNNKSGYFTDYTVTIELVPAAGGPAAREATWLFSVHYVPALATLGAPDGGPWA